jgi:hypothetical protein
MADKPPRRILGARKHCVHTFARLKGDKETGKQATEAEPSPARTHLHLTWIHCLSVKIRIVETCWIGQIAVSSLVSEFKSTSRGKQLST